MKTRMLSRTCTVALAVLLVPAPMPAQGPVNPDVPVRNSQSGSPTLPLGSDPAPGLYGLSSAGIGEVFAIDATTGEATPLVAINGASSFVGLSFLAGDAYASDLFGFPGSSGGFDVGLIDPGSGVVTFVSDQDGSSNWHGLATDEGAGLLYSIDIKKKGRAVIHHLVSLAADGTVTHISPSSGIDGRGMAFDDANGILYATGDDSLYTINATDGTAALVGPIGLGVLDQVGLAYDEDNDILYLNDGVTASLYALSVSNGAATLVGPNLFPNIDGLAWVGEAGIVIPTIEIPTLSQPGLAALILLLLAAALWNLRGRAA